MSSSVSSAAGKSVLTDCSSTSTYKDLHQGYTRRLLNGRHPRSFPKQSELWVHYRASNKRLERITKGHRLWHIVDKQDYDGEAWDEDWAANEDKGSRHENKDTNQVPSGGLKDLGVDLDASTKLHYGMVIVVVNSNEELVCVNEYNETMVKKLDQMTAKDHFLFKLVDLGDPTYPGPLVYSRPVWLQIFKRGAVDNSMQFGQLIGGKLFAPPSMSSAQLEQQARIAALKEEEQDRMSRSVVGGGAGRRRSSAATATSIESTESIEKGRRSRHKDVNFSAAVQAVDQPDVCGGISVINIMGGKSHGADKTDEAGSRHRTRSSWHLGQWIVRNAERREVTESKNKREQVASDDDVYLEQDLYCLASSAGSHFAPWPKRAHSPHSERYRKKAQRMNPAKLEKDVHSSNEGPLPTVELMSNVHDGLGTGDDQTLPELNSIHSEGFGYRPGTPDSDITSLSSLMPTVGLKEKDKIGISPTEDVFGCLRKVVLRGPPYVLVVDRKCVWRLCPANNFGDTNELSAKEKIAHKLLRSAEEGLEQSRRGREGARVHDNISFDGNPLLGGEKFPKQLRTILSHHAFNKETKQLNLRRKQEKLIESHFHGLYGEGRGWPDGKPFPSPLPKPSRCSPPSSPNDSFYITTGNHTEPAPKKSEIGSTPTPGKLTSKTSSSGLKDDNTYGADMLRLHRSLHAANVKLIGTMASNNPPVTPFSATFGYAGDINTASIVPSSSGGTRGSSMLTRRHDSGESLSTEGQVGSGYGQSREKDKGGVHNVETALAMGRLTKRLEKLAAVDEVVNQALRHRERIAKYGRIAAVFKNLSSADGLSKEAGEKLFIPDINIDGYDPSCGT